MIPGEQSSPEVHAAAFALNVWLGAVGKTVVYNCVTVNPMPSEQIADLKALVADMGTPARCRLVMLGVNPPDAAPPDLEFAAPRSKRFRTPCTWARPRGRRAQCWVARQQDALPRCRSDARAYDGTISIIQPMIAPLYGGHSAHEILQSLLDAPQMSAYDAVLANAKTYMKGDFATAWRKALHDGWVDGTAFTPGSAKAANTPAAIQPAAMPTGGVEIRFLPDPSLYDGR